MDNVIVCSVENAFKVMQHLNKDDMVVLAVVNKKTHIHDSKKIRKENGEELIRQADKIFYQDNDFFGRISLYGVLKDENLIHSILFPQLE